MNKKSRFLFVSLLFVLMFVLAGCRAQTDSTNAYKLPLGESGYISELDFDLYRKEDVIDEYNAVVDSYYYDYTELNGAYEAVLSAKVVSSEKVNFEGKAFKLVVGYYSNALKALVLW